MSPETPHISEWTGASLRQERLLLFCLKTGCYYTAQPSLKLGILLPQPPNAAVTWANVPGVKESSFLIVLCCMYLHMLVYMHTDVPRPEVNAPVPSSVTPYLTFWDQVSHRTWSSLTGLDRMAIKPQGSSCLWHLSTAVTHTHCYAALLMCVLLESHIQVFMNILCIKCFPQHTIVRSQGRLR